MFADLDRTLQRLLEHELPREITQQVTISFETPDDRFPPTSVSLPAIDLFLYDVRENLELRTNEWIMERDQLTTQRKRAPVRVDCSYLITAWASDSAPRPAEDEHQLLGMVMIGLLRHRILSGDFLQGALADQSLPLPTTTLQPGSLQSIGEFWQALGGKPKAALNYKVTISVDPYSAATAPLVTDMLMRLSEERIEE